ncbi:MAG: hypothetical protein ACOWYE_10045 [Desulfatiglandales bacterium]
MREIVGGKLSHRCLFSVTYFSMGKVGAAPKHPITDTKRNMNTRRIECTMLRRWAESIVVVVDSFAQ